MRVSLIATCVGACLTTVSFAATAATPAKMATPTKVAAPAPATLTAPIVMHASLKVPQEATLTAKTTPASAQGVGAFLFYPGTDTLKYFISFSGMSSAPFMAHFHHGAALTDGPIIQTLCGKPAPSLQKNCTVSPKDNYGILSGSWTVPAKDVAMLLSGNVFVNIHTKLNPGGEIRGQVMP